MPIVSVLPHSLYELMGVEPTDDESLRTLLHQYRLELDDVTEDQEEDESHIVRELFQTACGCGKGCRTRSLYERAGSARVRTDRQDFREERLIIGYIRRNKTLRVLREERTRSRKTYFRAERGLYLQRLCRSLLRSAV